MTMPVRFLSRLLALAVNGLACALVVAQTLPTPSQVNVSVNATVAYDPNTGMFTYSYTLTNFADAALEVDDFVIPLRATSVINVQSPAGWESLLHFDGSKMHWCACSENGFTIPPGYVQDGRGLPSKFQIKPGQTLSGFSFQSAYPQSPGEFYAGGWVPILIEGVDFPEGQEPQTPGFPANMFRGALAASPFSNPTLEFGGRRPAVDGFLVFTSIKDGGSYPAPLLIDVLFGQQGEVVDTSTFKATLNGVDITSQFVTLDPKRRRAQVTIGSALKMGKNVLTTSIQGTVPGASRSAKDTDRVTFLIQ
jgi:hypothetical protein